MKQFLRQIPPIHELQRDKRFTYIMENNGIDIIYITDQLKLVIENIRKKIIAGEWDNYPIPGGKAFSDEIFKRLEDSVKSQFAGSLQKIINATGTILHTNLGRARLGKRAANHMLKTALYYSNLEYNLQAGKRGSRHSHAEELIKKLTGAEAAMVVNNNAAAVYLILRALAQNKEVIVSRGQLVEIGGSFRISSIMEESGAQLKEVGTTNKTHLFDYERAITDQTALILKVHTSNFKVIGFTNTVKTNELAALAKNKNIIFYEDLGSGAIYDFSQYGIGDEPVVKQVIKMGTDLVSFSGDKLLGGPQAGIIAGKKGLIDLLKKHQLARVLRVDKMTLAALEGTLIDYLNGETVKENIPIIRDILVSQEELRLRTEAFINKLSCLDSKYSISAKESISQIGGGTMPDVEIPSYAAALMHKNMPADKLAQKLRSDFTPGIIVRIQKDEVLIDLRTVTNKEEEHIIRALKQI